MLVDSIEIKAFEKIVFHKVVFKAPYRHTNDLVNTNRACFVYIVKGTYQTFTNSSYNSTTKTV